MKPGLTLSRKVDESVIITDRITGKHIVTVTLLGLRESCAKLHFAADMDYAIWRNELNGDNSPPAIDSHDIG